VGTVPSAQTTVTGLVLVSDGSPRRGWLLVVHTARARGKAVPRRKRKRARMQVWGTRWSLPV